MFVVAVSPGFNEKLGEIEQALQGARRGDRAEAMRALACAEAAVRDDLRGDGAQGAISMMKHALRIRIEFAFPFDDSFWEAVDFIDNCRELSRLQRKIARRSLRGIALSIPSPANKIAEWIEEADTTLTRAEVDAIRM